MLDIVFVAGVALAGVIQLRFQYFQQARLSLFGSLAIRRHRQNAVYFLMQLRHVAPCPKPQPRHAPVSRRMFSAVPKPSGSNPASNGLEAGGVLLPPRFSLPDRAR